jgi:hypothetical protein
MPAPMMIMGRLSGGEIELAIMKSISKDLKLGVAYSSVSLSFVDGSLRSSVLANNEARTASSLW